MRLLIDGYNVMYAAGRLGPKLKGPEAFRMARQRFLNELAARLGPVEAAAATVVFDAQDPPEGRPATLRHKGITVRFAVTQEDADGEIEQMIAKHSSPKTLTVVSSDLRIREAARRRKARVMTADVFLDDLDQRRRRQEAQAAQQKRATLPEDRRPAGDDRGEWLQAFGDLEDDPSLGELRAPDPFVPDADELARIAREVARETTPDRGRLPRTGRR